MSSCVPWEFFKKSVVKIICEKKGKLNMLISEIGCAKKNIEKYYLKLYMKHLKSSMMYLKTNFVYLSNK